ncbi:MAG: hypothetical protein JWM47_2143 [Acidimicrobiales bacterium]|jgi:hypothetical protein|nr:hypothetical protein [Acidimicrobiales bacterium]
MHAVLFHVDKKEGWEGDGEAELDFITKMSSDSPGYVRGIWADNEQHGMSLQLFESEETARQCAEGATIPPEASVIFRSVEVFEVRRDV